MKGIISFSVLILAYICTVLYLITTNNIKEEKTDNIVHTDKPIMLDIAGNQLYIIPVNIRHNAQCYIVGPKGDAPSLHCDFVREKK
jgi:hypothetical protein